MIFWSKYFSNANENKNNEKIEIIIEGIKVNKVKNPIYLILEFVPLIFISFLREFLTPLKIIIKKIISKTTLRINRNWRFD